MERHTKLVAGSLGLCYVFMAFMCVSAVNVYNPRFYIKEIVKQLDKLKDDLTKMNVGDIKLNGPIKYHLEHEKHCAGTFLDAFQNGTKDISNLVFNRSVHHITNSIDDCVNKLRKRCHSVQKHNLKCNDYVCKEGILLFVDQFLEFSSSQLLDICGNSAIQENELSEEYYLNSAPICGNH